MDKLVLAFSLRHDHVHELYFIPSTGLLFMFFDS